MACCQHDYRVRFVTAAELVTLLVEAQQQGRLQRKLAQLARFDVVILDELGYVPFDKAGADLLFGFISQRYERRSLVVTTNLPFARWSEVFPMPQPIVHHATVLTTAGDSYRLKVATRLPRDTGGATAIALVATWPPVAPLRPATSRRPPQLKNGGPFSRGQKVPFLLAIPTVHPDTHLGSPGAGGPRSALLPVTGMRYSGRHGRVRRGLDVTARRRTVVLGRARRRPQHEHDGQAKPAYRTSH